MHNSLKVGVAFTLLLAGASMRPARGAAVVGLNFTGVTLSDTFALGTEATPPDTMGAVGPNHYVELVNGAYAVYNKSTGALIGSKVSDRQFWTSAGFDPGANNLTDPRIVYDSNSGRWFAIQITLESTNNKILVARSDTSDPTGAWKATNFTGPTSEFGDYPTLGIDANGVYIATNNFASASGSSTGTVSLYSIPKADLIAATPSVARLTRFDNQSQATRGYVQQPVVDYGASKGNAVVVTTENFTPASTLKRTDIIGTTNSGATLSATTTIGVSQYINPPVAHQPANTTDTTLDTVDLRITANAYQVGNVIYLAHETTVSGRVSVRWTTLNATNNTMISEGTVSDANFDFFQPSIAVSSTGNVVLTYNRSSQAEGSAGNIAIYAQAGTSNNGVLSFDSPQLLIQSPTGSFSVITGKARWGDYAATTVDPNNPNIFWTINEFADASNDWATQITQLTVPEPGALSVVVLLGLALLRRRLG